MPARGAVLEGTYVVDTSGGDTSRLFARGRD